MFWVEIWKISKFLSENFRFFGGKIFSIFEQACFRNGIRKKKENNIKQNKTVKNIFADMKTVNLLEKCPQIVFDNVYCPFDITRKDFFFAWRFILNENILTDHILSETICLLCYCVLFSNMYPKIKFIAKNLSDLCNFYRKVIFWDVLTKKIFFTFLCWI